MPLILTQCWQNEILRLYWFIRIFSGLAYWMFVVIFFYSISSFEYFLRLDFAAANSKYSNPFVLQNHSQDDISFCSDLASCDYVQKNAIWLRANPQIEKRELLKFIEIVRYLEISWQLENCMKEVLKSVGQKRASSKPVKWRRSHTKFARQCDFSCWYLQIYLTNKKGCLH